MENIMSSAILITVKLRGQLGGPKKHVDKQTVSVDVSPIGSKRVEIMTRKIDFTERGYSECCRKTRISEEVVSEWENSSCPQTVKNPSVWSKMTKKQKVEFYVERHNEGFGVSYESLH